MSIGISESREAHEKQIEMCLLNMQKQLKKKESLDVPNQGSSFPVYLARRYENFLEKPEFG